MIDKRTRCGTAVLWLLGMVIVSAPALAQHPNVARGFTPSGMFAVGGIDTVNGFNGNMSIRIPIGTSYPVGGLMGPYSFSLNYNSNVWNHLSRDGFTPSGAGSQTPVTSVYAVPNPFAEAGLGWSFSLGRIGNLNNGGSYIAPRHQGETTFHAADGAEHVLFNSMSAPGGSVTDGSYWFSNDGSHLRYNSGTGVLEFPDGARETFNGAGYPTSLRDRFGNGLSITYSYDFPSAPDIPSMWTINDGTRQHAVIFRLTGYEWPLQRAVVDSIQVAKFGGGTATYKFLYNGEDELGNGFQDVAMTGFGTQLRIYLEPSWRPKVYVLTRLILPDGTSYSMPLANYVQNNASCDGTSYCEGPIGRMVLPTGGALEWDYQLRPMPAPRSDENQKWTIPTWSFSVHVAKRRLYDERGGLVGEWKYGYPDDDLNILPRWDVEIVSQVTYPPAEPGRAGGRVVTYYSACGYGTCQTAGQSDTYASEYALPFSRVRPDDGAGRYLSQEIYPAGNTTPVRRIYVRYENDGPPGYAYDTTLGMPKINQRLQSQRTFFLDDVLPVGKGYAWAAVVHSEYDGLGHYRKVAMTDNFGYSTARTEKTNWNPNGAPSTSQPWLLNLFDYQEQQEGSSLAHQEFLFEPDTGFLACKRFLKNGGTRGAFDVLVSYEHTDNTLPGFVTMEKWYGGDSQNINGKNCNSLPPTAVYVYSHAYSAGARRETAIQALKVLDLDIDAASGLTLALRDVSGLRTNFTYDSMGRLTSSAPQGDAVIGIEYRIQSVPMVVDQTLGSGGLSLGEQKVMLDGLGRIVRDEMKMPGGTWSASVTAYNAMGWKLYESEPLANPVVPDLAMRCEKRGGGTAYCNFDAFGRPGTIMTADGKTTRLDYQGARVVLRTRHVWNGSEEVGATTREEYDSLGRLRRIREPNKIEPNGKVTEGAWTYYWYDMGGRLSSVTANATKLQQQTRTFHYDGRGFLDREVQPESGTVSYEYDSRGNVTKKMTPTGTILYEYDKAGRLTQVGVPQAGVPQPQPLRILSYFADTSASGSAIGKLKEARAFNSRLVGSSCLTFEVKQGFEYNATHGRLETEKTSLYEGGSLLEAWSQGYVYDEAGQVKQINYPSCLERCNATARSQSFTYTMGRPTAVPGFASSITYNDNGLVKKITHSNNVIFTQTPDESGMARPGTLGTNRTWTNETYSYDGSGNIKKIGGKDFGYDVSSRLISAKIPGVSLPYRGYKYDAFGNLTEVEQGTSAQDPNRTSVVYTPNPATNRLQGASYDNSGRLFSYQGSTYTWDVLNNVTTVNTGNEEWVHTYDAAGERVWSWKTGSTRKDTYALRGLDGKVLTDFTREGSTYTWEDYIYREGQLLAASLRNGSTAQVIHFDLDHLGSVRQETDDSGALIKYREFWPYGEEATPSSGTEQMKFTGHERDLGVSTSTADDIDYMHARYYKPLFARFLSPDPVSGSVLIPQTWNGYTYGLGNPVRYTDPSGMSSASECGFRVFCELITVTGVLSDRRSVSLAEVYHFFGGAANAYASDLLWGGGRYDRDIPAYQAGQVVGDFAGALTGVYAMYQGGELFLLGLAGDATIAGSPGGVTLNAAGLLESYYGFRVTAQAMSNLKGGGGGGGGEELEATPDTDREAFGNVRGSSAKVNKDTGEIWVKDRFHKDHYEVYSSKKDFENGKRTRAVWADGRLKEYF
ncbi:MAG TPA: RHS repeat-associated core domain-containing protein [Thermoanaerobaculia bacterium]|nr:RHS repeat-associated core domain-containing protein [Thermoanaerobaculia bacterium]